MNEEIIISKKLNTQYNYSELIMKSKAIKGNKILFRKENHYKNRKRLGTIYRPSNILLNEKLGTL
jgi:hypothetical protein